MGSGRAGLTRVLLIEELVSFAEQLDGDHHHPVANAAGELWGLRPPGFVRSSASHVMVAAELDGSQRVVLRLRPDTEANQAAFRRAAGTAAAWVAAGAPFVPAVPSSRGALIETVQGYVVMAMEAVEGETLEEEGLPQGARAWGAALARLHSTAPGGPALPLAIDLLQAPGADPRLAELVADLREQLGQLPFSSDVYGALHGDPEADNVVVDLQGPRFVDPDEARNGWYAADIAFALRDWAAPGHAPDLGSAVPRSFLTGYEQVRRVSREEREWLPLMARASAAEDLLRLQPHLGAVPDVGWPAWATQLDARIRQRAASFDEALLLR